MDLILWRHAQAYELAPEEMRPSEGGRSGLVTIETLRERDLARRLTEKGEAQAERMAAWLKERLSENTRIIVSPAQRTQQTVQPLQRPFETVAEIGPHASVDAVLQAARWPDADAPVLVVGHQPFLGLTASRLLTGRDEPLGMRKGAVWWFRSRMREGQREVILLAMVSPELA